MVVGKRLPWLMIVRFHARWLTTVFVISLGAVLVEKIWKLRVPFSPTPFSIVGVALSIFLAFRNNASYDRWWEGRKIWGGLVNVSRALGRQVMTLMAPPKGESADAVASLRREIIYRHFAYLNALRCALRDQDPRKELGPFLDAEEHAGLSAWRNVASGLLFKNGARIAEAAERGWLSEERLARFDVSLTEIAALQGACERIKKTPIPLAYRFFTHAFVRVYCLALPFGLVEHLGFLTLIVVMLMTFSFLVLDAIGGLIEDPFTMGPNCLPLSAMCRTIEIDMRQQLGERDIPDPVPVEKRGITEVLF